MGRTIMRITTIPIALKVLLESQMKFIHDHGFNVIMVSSDGKEIEELVKSEGCPHVIVNMTRKITPFQDIVSLLRLYRLMKKIKPDIVHTHTPKAGLLGMIAAKFCNIKIRIHTVAGLPLMVSKGVRYQVLILMEKITYSCATNVWPNSKSLQNFIIEKKLTQQRKLSLILNGSSNGIDLSRFNKECLDQRKLIKIKEELEYSDRFTYLLFVGRLVFDKGITELISSFVKLNAQNPTLKLILIGPYEKNLDPLSDQTIFELENNSSITRIHWTNQIEYYLDIADFFVFPSHREGFPNVLLQAGAMELPILCSDITGNIDLIENKKTGLIFKCKDEESLIRNISFAIKNPKLMNEYAANLKEVIYKKFKRQDVQNAILSEYKILLKE